MRASGKQGLSGDDAKKGGAQLLHIVLFLADPGDGDEREMHGGKTSVGHERVGCHQPGMREGIDAPLCGGSNRRTDPRTGLPYFPNQRLSETVMNATFWKVVAL